MKEQKEVHVLGVIIWAKIQLTLTLCEMSFFFHLFLSFWKCCVQLLGSHQQALAQGVRSSGLCLAGAGSTEH